MGGYGSGRKWDAKRTVDSQINIDVRWFKKNGRLRAESSANLVWSRNGVQTGSINYKMGAECLILQYRYRPRGGEWGNISEIIRLDWTPCNYGGYRTWFLCPKCNRRVAVLYLAGEYFLCRHCYQLNYATQHLQPYERLMERARAIRMRLGGSSSLVDCFPEKPKGMHWKTYLRLQEKSENANCSSLELARRQLGLS